MRFLSFLPCFSALDSTITLTSCGETEYNSFHLLETFENVLSDVSSIYADMPTMEIKLILWHLTMLQNVSKYFVKCLKGVYDGGKSLYGGNTEINRSNLEDARQTRYHNNNKAVVL